MPDPADLRTHSLRSQAGDIAEVLRAFARAPIQLGGICLRAWAGPRRSALLQWLRVRIESGAAVSNDQVSESGPAWRVLPHHADAAQLESGFDVGLSLAEGRPVRRPGLLDLAAPPIVVLSMAERMSLGLSASLAFALDQDRAALLVLDESLDNEDRPWPGLLDRLAVVLDLRDEELLSGVLDELARGVSGGTLDATGGVVPGMAEEALEALASASLMLDIVSARPIAHAARLARLLAQGRGEEEVEAEDLSIAIRFAMLPHARALPGSPETPETAQPPDAEPGRSEPESSPADLESGDSTAQADSNTEDQSMPDGAAERLIEAALASLPPDVLAELAGRAARARGRAAAAGAGHLTTQGRGRGRSVGARRGIPQGPHRLHLFATLRAAIPWQRLRAHGPADRSAGCDPLPRARLKLRMDDLHVHRELHRRGTTTVFVVDASGSTALQRLNEAKGAVELLLADCYVRRDRVALIAFRGRGAEVLLPPTRSLVAARRSLAALPGGGGSPIAAGLELAIRLVSALKRAGDDTQVVMLTDGRANLTRDGRPGRSEAAREAQTLARSLAGLASHRVLIDTSLRPEPAARALSEALDARYCLMPFARAQAIRSAIG